MDQVQNAQLFYHINSLELLKQYFSEVSSQLGLYDQIHSFTLSIKNSPPDQTLDIVKLYFKEFQLQQIRPLGNPRGYYAGILHQKLKSKTPQLKKILPSIAYVNGALPVKQAQFSSIITKNIIKQLQNQPIDVSNNIKIPLIFFEMLIRQKVNPWQICSYEYVISQISAQLKEFDPFACYLDYRSARNYRIYSASENRLSATDLAMPKFFNPRQTLAAPGFCQAMELLRCLHRIESPTQITLVLTIVFNLLQDTVKTQLNDYNDAKYEAKLQGEVQQQQTLQAEKIMEFDQIAENSTDLSRVASSADLSTQLQCPESSGQLDLQIQSECNTDSVDNHSSKTPDSEVLQASAPIITSKLQMQNKQEPAIFGADELTPYIIFAIHISKARQLNKCIAVAEHFSLPQILKIPAIEYALLMMKSAGIAYSNGFAQYRTVVMPDERLEVLHGEIVEEEQ